MFFPFPHIHSSSTLNFKDFFLFHLLPRNSWSLSPFPDARKGPQLHKPCRLYTQSISTHGTSPFPPPPSNQSCLCFSQALEKRNGRACTALEAHWPGHLPTCSACSSARWQSATANDSVLFCCTPAFTDSRLFILSNIWACCRAIVLGRGQKGIPVSQETQVPLSYTLQLPREEMEEVTPLCKLWLRESSFLPMLGLLSSGQGEQESLKCVASKETRGGYDTTGSSKLQTSPHPHL